VGAAKLDIPPPLPPIAADDQLLSEATAAAVGGIHGIYLHVLDAAEH
jgi:hypothetical protein